MGGTLCGSSHPLHHPSVTRRLLCYSEIVSQFPGNPNLMLCFLLKGLESKDFIQVVAEWRPRLLRSTGSRQGDRPGTCSQLRSAPRLCRLWFIPVLRPLLYFRGHQCGSCWEGTQLCLADGCQPHPCCSRTASLFVQEVQGKPGRQGVRTWEVGPGTQLSVALSTGRAASCPLGQ